jgi:hypothetical protein
MQSIKEVLEEKKRKLEGSRARKSVWGGVIEKISRTVRYITSWLI